MKRWKQYKVVDLMANNKLVIGDGYRAKNEELVPFGIPFARAGNIDNGFKFHDADFFPEVNIARVGNKISQPCDVVFTSKGTVGRFAFVDESTPRFVYSPQLCFWRSLDHQTIDPRFLFYWMSGREFLVQFKSVASQTDMAEYVSLTDQRRMNITFPEIEEQRSIARVLGTIDDKIELNRKMNETLEATARALFKAWFVDFDPVRAKAEGRQPAGMDAETAALFPDEFEEIEGREVPRGWSVRPLDETADYLNGLALQKFPPEGDDFLPVIKIAQLRRNGVEGADRASRSIEPAYIVNDGDILFSWSGSLEVVVWCGGKGALNQHLFKVSSTDYPKWFYYYWTKQHLPDFQEIAAGKATTMGHIQRHHLHQALTIVPSSEILRAADQIMSPILGRLIAAQIETRTLAALRDTLLPKLMSGEVRVRDVEAEFITAKRSPEEEVRAQAYRRHLRPNDRYRR